MTRDQLLDFLQRQHDNRDQMGRLLDQWTIRAVDAHQRRAARWRLAFVLLVLLWAVDAPQRGIAWIERGIAWIEATAAEAPQELASEACTLQRNWLDCTPDRAAKRFVVTIEPGAARMWLNGLATESPCNALVGDGVELDEFIFRGTHLGWKHGWRMDLRSPEGELIASCAL